MKLYLSNKDTEYILFKPIRMNIQAAYSQLQVNEMMLYILFTFLSVIIMGKLYSRWKTFDKLTHAGTNITSVKQ